MIDIGKRSIREGMIYAVRFEDTVMIKRLTFRPGGKILIISDNRQEYESYEAEMKDLHIHRPDYLFPPEFRFGIKPGLLGTDFLVLRAKNIYFCPKTEKFLVLEICPENFYPSDHAIQSFYVYVSPHIHQLSSCRSSLAFLPESPLESPPTKKKRVAGFLQLPVYTGGADETRTRDLRRDRPAF